MPWTFSHPAAVLPFRRLYPERLNFPALVIGSVAPDAGYYVNQFEIARWAHSLVGAVVVCIPSGLLLLFMFLLMRRPLWFLLPEPHRSALEPLVADRSYRRASYLPAAMTSIVLGAWTHVIWDAFTHGGTWITERVAMLREVWLQVGEFEFQGYSVLQHSSTVMGAAVLGIAYFRWLRSRPRPAGSSPSDRWRYLAMLASGLLSVSIAIPLALHAAVDHTGQQAWGVFIFRTAIYSVCVLAVLLLVYAACYPALQRNVQPSTRRSAQQ